MQQQRRFARSLHAAAGSAVSKQMLVQTNATWINFRSRFIAISFCLLSSQFSDVKIQTKLGFLASRATFAGDSQVASIAMTVGLYGRSRSCGEITRLLTGRGESAHVVTEPARGPLHEEERKFRGRRHKIEADFLAASHTEKRVSHRTFVQPS